jgi:hypothetical protein
MQKRLCYGLATNKEEIKKIGVPALKAVSERLF